MVVDKYGNYGWGTVDICMTFYMRALNIFFSLLVSEGVIIDSRTDPRSRISLPWLIIIFIINRGQ
jgi:hypothetical protein